jgi:hypothetical protein
MHVFVQAYRGLKSCTSLLEDVSLLVPTCHVRDLTFSVCPSKNHCPARCAYADKVVDKDFDIFALGEVSLFHIL